MEEGVETMIEKLGYFLNCVKTWKNQKYTKISIIYISTKLRNVYRELKKLINFKMELKSSSSLLYRLS